jgi:hypothetical protein
MFEFLNLFFSEWFLLLNNVNNYLFDEGEYLLRQSQGEHLSIFTEPAE